ncbi:mRNA-capping enzyme-like [Galendromus occidentalis]|uniref:mRNA-capping enzyme-like n=1 Tax=Galendromus occidentalis TaxID=34638 RepID=A0AAJ6QM43_9ACAR|nr:mRNA-capping enzyme-like [Galendromus occidentalis]
MEGAPDLQARRSTSCPRVLGSETERSNPSTDEGIDSAAEYGAHSSPENAAISPISGNATGSAKSTSPEFRKSSSSSGRVLGPAGVSKEQCERKSPHTESSRNRDKDCAQSQCPLHGQILVDGAAAEFIDFCEEVRSKNPLSPVRENGQDRIGSLICEFLVNKKSWDTGAAIIAVRKAREPGICEEKCIDALSARVGSTDGDGAKNLFSQQLPTLDSAGRRLRELMAKIPGLAVAEDPLWVRKFASQLSGCREPGFPGARHTRISEENLLKLSGAAYRVTWKSDGLRFLLLMTHPGVTFLLGEEDEAYQVSGFSFPYSKDASRPLFTTLLDGELVFDLDGGISRPRYLIHDIIHFRLQKMWKMNFSERESCIQKEIIDVRRRYAQEGILDLKEEPFSIRKKEFFPLGMTSKIIAPKFRSQVSHRVDGVIFKAVHEAYSPGPSDALLEFILPQSLNGAASAFQDSLLENIRHTSSKESKSPSPPFDEPGRKRHRSLPQGNSLLK